MTRTARQNVGQIGEDIAAQYLRANGYAMIGRNVRLHPQEIDIIAKDLREDVLVFVEVKTLGTLKEAFSPSMNARIDKWRALTHAARRWVAWHDYRGGYRFDLICVAGGNITEHVKEVGAWR